MPSAARQGDFLLNVFHQPPTASIMKGSPNVLIGGRPAACVGDGAWGEVIVKGSATVLINGKPAARVGDPTTRGGIVLPPGATHVLIG